MKQKKAVGRRQWVRNYNKAGGQSPSKKSPQLVMEEKLLRAGCLVLNIKLPTVLRYAV